MAEATKQITKKKDFVAIEFIGRNLTNNEVFDSNVLEEAKKINPDVNGVRPLIACIGSEMVVKGFDEALEGKEVGKKYNLKLTFDKAFGKRFPNLVKLIPMKIFLAQKIMPQPGMTLALDNNLVRVMSVSGGRVMVDFNNPLAGKDIEYEFTIQKILSDTREKTSALQKYLFNQEFEFDVDEKNKKIIFKEVKLAQLLDVFRDKFKDMLGFDVEIFAKTEKKENKEETKKADDKKA